MARFFLIVFIGLLTSIDGNDEIAADTPHTENSQTATPSALDSDAKELKIESAVDDSALLDESDDIFADYDPLMGGFGQFPFHHMLQKGLNRHKRGGLPYDSDALRQMLGIGSDENLDQYLMDHDASSDETAEVTDTDSDDNIMDYKNLEEAELMRQHPAMRRLHMFEDDEEEEDEEKLFANQFPSMDEMMAKGMDLNSLYKKLAAVKP